MIIKNFMKLTAVLATSAILIYCFFFIDKVKWPSEVPHELHDYVDKVQIEWVIEGENIGYKVTLPKISVNYKCNVSSGILNTSNQDGLRSRKLSSLFTHTSAPDPHIGILHIGDSNRDEVIKNGSYAVVDVTCYDERNEIIYKASKRSNAFQK